MEDEFQDQGHIDKYFKELLYPRGSQPNHGLFYEEEKQESTRVEGLSPESEVLSP